MNLLSRRVLMLTAAKRASSFASSSSVRAASMTSNGSGAARLTQRTVSAKISTCTEDADMASVTYLSDGALYDVVEFPVGLLQRPTAQGVQVMLCSTVQAVSFRGLGLNCQAFLLSASSMR